MIAGNIFLRREYVILAMIVLLNDGLLRFKNADPMKHTNTRRFFEFTQKLPLEIIHLICRMVLRPTEKLTYPAYLVEGIDENQRPSNEKIQSVMNSIHAKAVEIWRNGETYSTERFNESLTFFLRNM